VTKEITDAAEDYLECIYRLQHMSGVARTSDIVRMTGVVPGTVTNTVERLEKAGLVTHEPYKGVRLTDKGRKIAIDVLRKHRLSERLLTDILEIDWDESHTAACELEHSLTVNVVKNLEKTLGHPRTCPHGNPVPSKSGSILEEESEPMENLKLHEGGVIVKITQEEPDLLRNVANLSLKPGSFIEVVRKDPFNGSITIRNSKGVHVLGRDIPSKIWIKKRLSQRNRI
jgi:DtxR family Mn-dependent transcriptional regulator